MTKIKALEKKGSLLETSPMIQGEIGGVLEGNTIQKGGWGYATTWLSFLRATKTPVIII